MRKGMPWILVSMLRISWVFTTSVYMNNCSVMITFPEPSAPRGNSQGHNAYLR